jgi:NADH:ubiquinone oxidoreductase subunit E/NAD-dependent dihydropyrimidine dehydrogenase PreA subunit
MIERADSGLIESRQSDMIGAALVVGGGIGGMQAALDLAGAGIKVYLVEQLPGVGGIMAQLDKTFPTNDCAMCTMAPRLADLSRHKDIELLTLAEVERIDGSPGNFSVTVRQKARYVDESRCTGCGTCVASCPVRYHVQPIPEGSRVVPALAAADRSMVEGILARWKGREGPLMPILQEVNAHFNYFPEPVLRLVAQQTGCPLTHIYRIATFYSAFSNTPRGKYTINVCMGTTCYVHGSERLMEKFAGVLGAAVDETTKDRLFTLKSVRCLGCCGLAPVATIGSETYGRLAAKDVPTMIQKHRETARG